MTELTLYSRLRMATNRVMSMNSHLPPTSELSSALANLQAVVEEVCKHAIFPTGEIVRHPKRGSEYRVYGVAHLNSADENFVRHILPDCSGGFSREEKRKVAFDRDEVVVYADITSGAISVRPTEEFRDGRFVTIKP